MRWGKILANKLICREIFGDFGFKSKDTKLVRKLILVNGSRFVKFGNIFPRHIIALYTVVILMQSE